MFSRKKTVSETDTTEKSFLNQYKLRRQYQTMTIGFVMVSAVVVFLLLVVTENPIIVALIGKSFFDRPVIEKITEKVVVATPGPEPTAAPTEQPQGIVKYVDSPIDTQFQLQREVGTHGEYYLVKLVDKESQSEVFDGPLPLVAKWIQSFYFDQDQKALYVIEGTGPYGEQYSEFSKIAFNNNQYTKKILLVKNSSYKQETHIEKIYSDNKIALTTSSADGCSGEGEISVLEDSVERVIAHFGMGSTNPKLPRIIGYANDRWYLYRVQNQALHLPELGCENYPASEVFTLTSDSVESQTEIPAEKLPQNVTFIKFSKDDPERMYLLTADEKMYEYTLSSQNLSLSALDPTSFFVITRQ